MSEFNLQTGDRMLFIGDSITDAGRRNEATAPFGTGYVSMIVNLVTARYPGRQIEFVNRGIGGNTVLDLERRWQEDAIDVSPTWLSVMIGINDVHRCYRQGDEQPDPETYDRVYDQLLSEIAEKVSPRIVLVEPFYLCSDPEHDINRMLTPYFETVHRLAEKYGAILVPVHQAFQEALALREDALWANDNVHPFPEGHAFIALEWLKALGW